MGRGRVWLPRGVAAQLVIGEDLGEGSGDGS